jgi:hypothetical protein
VSGFSRQNELRVTLKWIHFATPRGNTAHKEPKKLPSFAPRDTIARMHSPKGTMKRPPLESGGFAACQLAPAQQWVVPGVAGLLLGCILSGVFSALSSPTPLRVSSGGVANILGGRGAERVHW